jgi:hypothetical protein
MGAPPVMKGIGSPLGGSSGREDHRASSSNQSAAREEERRGAPSDKGAPAPIRSKKRASEMDCRNSDCGEAKSHSDRKKTNVERIIILKL